MTDQNLTPVSNPQDAQSVNPNQSPLPSQAPQGQGTPAAVKGNFWRGMYITTNIVLILGIVLYVTSFVLAQIGFSDFENMLRDLELDTQDISQVMRKLSLNHLTPYLLIMTAALVVVFAVSLRFKKNNWLALLSGFILPLASAIVCIKLLPIKRVVCVSSNHTFTSVSDVLEHTDLLVQPEALQYAMMIGVCTTIVVICVMLLLIAIYGLHLLITKKKSKAAIVIVSMATGIYSLFLVFLAFGLALLIYSMADRRNFMKSFLPDKAVQDEMISSAEAEEETAEESSTTTNTSAFSSTDSTVTTSAPSTASPSSTASSSSTASQRANAAGGGNHNWNFGVLKTRLLTERDIAGYSSSELRVLRNAIYAMHGYRFKDQTLTDYFRQFSWYTPRYSDVSDQLNETERKNVLFLKSHE